MIGLCFRPWPPQRLLLSVAGNIPAVPHPCHQTAFPEGQYIYPKFFFCCGNIHIAYGWIPFQVCAVGVTNTTPCSEAVPRAFNLRNRKGCPPPDPAAPYETYNLLTIFILLSNCVYKCACLCVGMDTGVELPMRPERMSSPWKLELQVVVNRELQYSVRAEYAPKH